MNKLKITYCTNTSFTESSGGGSGVNTASFHYLSQKFDIHHTSIINPPTAVFSKLISVLKKKIGLKRNYHHFSESRLKAVNKQFENENTDTQTYFFHGFTQWIKTKPKKPYFCFNDACFATYVEIYNNKAEFDPKDLERIYRQEAQWLDNATKVFFRSQWALDKTKVAYSLLGNNFVNVGVGGFIDIPQEDMYTEGQNFLFLSREFVPKGGLVVVEAFEKVRIKFPNAKLWLVGQKPHDVICTKEGIEYLGFFNKNIESENKQLRTIFSNTFCLIHPTTKDTNTLVINELAYFGCPAIASNRFAIAEYIIPNKTGFLIDNPLDSDEVANKMQQLLGAENYKEIRKQTRANAIQNNTWEQVYHKISYHIEPLKQ